MKKVRRRRIYLKKKKTVLFIIYIKCGSKDEKIFKEEESIEILEILCLIDNIE